MESSKANKHCSECGVENPEVDKNCHTLCCNAVVCAGPGYNGPGLFSFGTVDTYVMSCCLARAKKQYIKKYGKIVDGFHEKV